MLTYSVKGGLHAGPYAGLGAGAGLPL